MLRKCPFAMKGGLHMKMTDLLGEATEYDKKQAVEKKKSKAGLRVSVPLQIQRVEC